ncbi:TIGR03663 family protein [Halolamina litorea]|uniref:Flippase activity-associated protein Agl23 n=1 Tax=Halolamina litorea TaxID=1515593 RepID=A0ABD6BQB6_9EURY|nr:flippase activity-associated protein Agl23 [Halolamina litorea]
MPRVSPQGSSDEDRATGRALRALLGLSALSLLVRLFGLGGRIFHWDEGRVGYWILRYHETGEFAYRPIIHGPFIQHADALLFHVVPATDFWARFPVAVVTAALPLTAWLLRRHLDDRETVALGLLLTFQPLLLYYSRFMRSDPLVGAFCFAAFALLVRAYDTRRLAPVFAASAALALGFASKENAILYVACFGGAAAVCYDHRLLRAGVDGADGTGSGARGRLRADGAAIREWAADRAGDPPYPVWAGGALGGVVATFIAITVVMYAPRPEAWNALGSVSALVDVSVSTLGDTISELTDVWLDRDGGDRSYLAFFHDIVETLVFGAPFLFAFGFVGYFADGFGLGEAAPRRRTLVSFCLYWAAASVIGYPIATDIQAPWAVYHIVLPLTVPAAVGVGALVGVVERELTAGDESLADALGRIADGGVGGLPHPVRALSDTDRTVPVVLAVLLLTGGAVGVVGLNVDYWNSTEYEDREVLQWAQPHNELKPTMSDVEAVAADNAGTDVLFYPSGSGEFYVADESSLQRAPPGGPAWHSRLPLPWYLERAGADVTSSTPDTPPAEALADAPPVVIAHDESRDELAAELDGYEVRQHPFKLWGEEVVVFIDREALAAA